LSWGFYSSIDRQNDAVGRMRNIRRPPGLFTWSWLSRYIDMCVPQKEGARFPIYKGRQRRSDFSRFWQLRFCRLCGLSVFAHKICIGKKNHNVIIIIIIILSLSEVRAWGPSLHLTAELRRTSLLWWAPNHLAIHLYSGVITVGDVEN